jgi:hypothetical protein
VTGATLRTTFPTPCGSTHSVVGSSILGFSVSKIIAVSLDLYGGDQGFTDDPGVSVLVDSAYLNRLQGRIINQASLSYLDHLAGAPVRRADDSTYIRQRRQCSGRKPLPVESSSLSWWDPRKLFRSLLQGRHPAPGQSGAM